VVRIDRREVDPLYDFLYNSFRRKGQSNVSGASQRAVNTLDEVPDSAWYTNRHVDGIDREQLVAGPGNQNPPRAEGMWRVLSAKSDGITPGFLIEDESERRYIVKFDPPRYQELSTGADVIGSKIFYALGYSTPENYIVYFQPSQLTVDAKATYRDNGANKRKFTTRQLEELLRDQPRDEQGRYRAMASLLIPGKLLGPFRYEGTRMDDPNDLVAHEDRRDLRGLSVFSAWLNHTDAKSINTLDTLVERDGSRFVQHFLIDFGATLGSDSFAAKDARLGHESFIDLKPTAWQVLSLGFYVPPWARTRLPQTASVGHFTAEGFQPGRWKPNYPNPAFDRLQPDDAFWAAKKVMDFSDSDIRAVVATGRYSDPAAAESIAQILFRRRDATGRAWLLRLLPLDHFTVSGKGELAFVDLAVKHGLQEHRPYLVGWSLYDNATGRTTTVADAAGFQIPDEIRKLPPAEYAVAAIHYAKPEGFEQQLATMVYLRHEPAGWTVVGVERTW
jgi:hypothetical protein